MIYVASGWFTPEQDEARKEILRTLNAYQYEFFSPKEDNLAKPCMGQTTLTSIFKINLEEIDNADMVVASTVGKDMGTIFECGYAYAKGIPIIYYAPGLEGPFNLMLAKSAHAVATTKRGLEELAKGGFKPNNYTGGIE